MIFGTPLVLLLAQAATPATPPAQAAPPSLTRTAVQSQVKGTFDRLDANKDGWVDKSEAQTAMSAAAAKRRADSITETFQKVDKNKDGQISRQEFEAATPMPKVDAASWITPNDTDKNGRVSLQEATARVVADFDRLDKDKNGVVTAQEANAGRKPR